MLQNNEKTAEVLKAEKIVEQAKARLAEAKRKASQQKRKEENKHKYMMGGIVHKYFPECYQFDEQELNRIIASGMKLEHCQANMVCSRQLYAEALGNDGNSAQWEIREINDIMNNCSDWIAFSNPRHFPEPYRRQKGWEKKTMKDKIKRLIENDVRGTQHTA